MALWNISANPIDEHRMQTKSFVSADEQAIIMQQVLSWSSLWFLVAVALSLRTPIDAPFATLCFLTTLASVYNWRKYDTGSARDIVDTIFAVLTGCFGTFRVCFLNDSNVRALLLALTLCGGACFVQSWRCNGIPDAGKHSVAKMRWHLGFRFYATWSIRFAQLGDSLVQLHSKRKVASTS
ncbi:hypothetical protein CYMTET_29203 [Cymbomonas tetramitiformis]|uniref:Uncharacterized protein n=1 Tax=Cymbomonas tetramitiformis TaxID=36881 RepID=A0AAE0KVE1_9CHLO|nr:hypothetical protein CYMTET_29203 [Cymbomonas tetramitiformis]